MVMLTNQLVDFYGTVPEFIFLTSEMLNEIGSKYPDFVFSNDFLLCSDSLLAAAEFLRDVRYFAHAVANRINMDRAGVTGREGC